MVSDGYVKYDEAEVHRSVIMQDFQDKEKKKYLALFAKKSYLTLKLTFDSELW